MTTCFKCREPIQGAVYLVTVEILRRFANTDFGMTYSETHPHCGGHAGPGEFKPHGECARCGIRLMVPELSRRMRSAYCSRACRVAAGRAAARTTRWCECGARLPERARADMRFCSVRCRVRYYRRAKQAEEMWAQRIEARA
jgi:hypothetical protein